MPLITIRIDDHGETMTVREMRRRLAQILSKLDGDHQVSFSFVARLDYSQPSQTECHHPWGFNPTYGHTEICLRCHLVRTRTT